MSLPLGSMKLIKTESNQAIHLFQMLGVTEEQFEQARTWYLSAQKGYKNNNKMEGTCTEPMRMQQR